MLSVSSEAHASIFLLGPASANSVPTTKSRGTWCYVEVPFATLRSFAFQLARELGILVSSAISATDVT